MPQIKKSYTEINVPLQKMTFTPDVPSNALAANEYNEGYNVETDVRGIRSVLGEEQILGTVPGIPTYVTGGYRQSDVDPLTPDPDHRFWFVVATDEGKWYCNNSVTGWVEITPLAGSGYSGSDYDQSINITDSWNGTVPIFNDTFNAPFFWPDEPGTPKLVMYKQNIPVKTISNIAYNSPTTQKITINTTAPNTAYATAPFVAGDKILIKDINSFFNGIFTVVSSTTTEIVYTATPGGAYPGGGVGSVAAAYTWNYNPNWTNLTAAFVRIYSTPNVGNILVAGNLTATNKDGSISKYPVTVAWSQAFGLNSAPLTWQPTLLNVANQVEVPVRGELLDGWPSNGQFYLNSYWDTVVLSPLNYTTTTAPILGIRLFNQGRGMLTQNCWANSDNAVYGIDSRDIWVFNGNNFQGLGNQRVKHWFFDQLDPAYVDRVYIECNTEKNQIEIYYPDQNAPAGGVPNRMLSYRYDIDVWNAPRYVSKATYACESPVWTYNSTLGQWFYNKASRGMVYAKGATAEKLIQKDRGFRFVDNQVIESKFRRDNMKLCKDYSTKVLVHRILPEIVNLNANNVEIDPTTNPELVGNVKFKVEGANAVGQTPLFQVSQAISTNTNYPWVQINQNAHRVESVEFTNDPTTPDTIWMCNELSFQTTEVEDDR